MSRNLTTVMAMGRQLGNERHYYPRLIIMVQWGNIKTIEIWGFSDIFKKKIWGFYDNFRKKIWGFPFFFVFLHPNCNI